MFCTTKKIICTTAITAILNLSFQPAYAVRIEPLDEINVEPTHSSRPIMEENPPIEILQTSAPVDQQWMTEFVKEAGYYSFSVLKGLTQLPQMASKGIIYAVKHPIKVLTLSLVGQVATVSALNIKRQMGQGNINLGSLTPNQGFAISGVATDDYSGYSVSSAGDFNGDGLNDVIIGAYGANNYAGQSYVIYGTNSQPISISLSSLTPNQGFTINDAVIGYSGHSVSSAGDFNGDGLSDVIIGAPFVNNATGKTYVIYGTNSQPISISLSSLTPLQGFTINGAVPGDESGFSVSSAGDFNGDSFNDIIIGAPGANNQAGDSYLIYGTNSYPNSLSLSSLTPNQGFNITGAEPGDWSGWSVSSAGDFNGDSLNDIIIGAPFTDQYDSSGNDAGRSYVIYGTNSKLSSLSLSSLTQWPPTQGFTITGAAPGDRSGWSVSSAGDFNSDGLNDIIIGAPGIAGTAGNSYVIYGTTTPPGLISLSSLTVAPNQGFAIIGDQGNSGNSVSLAGDFNGDDLNDIIIGAPGVSIGANLVAGESYIIYGTKSKPSSLSLSSLTPLQGFTISGAAAYDYSGYSVSSAVDFNSDNLNDLIIGAYGANNYTGNSYIIYGSLTPPPSPPVQSSSENRRKSGTSWKIYAAIGGGIGGAIVVGVVGGIIVKKCCFSKNTGYSRIND